jgi:hypothetical protein
VDAQRIVVKVYLEDKAVAPHDFIPVFHRWIQTRALDEVLIDVADYSHVHDGPGVLLICHEANYAIDVIDGRPGLVYARKREVTGSWKERVRQKLGSPEKRASRRRKFSFASTTDSSAQMFRQPSRLRHRP